jgi:hypothetical protein
MLDNPDYKREATLDTSQEDLDRTFRTQQQELPP